MKMSCFLIIVDLKCKKERNATSWNFRDEYQEIIEQQTTTQIAENVILLIMNSINVKYVDPHFRLQLITSDPDDNKFVDCAIASGADYIVSEDSHFDILARTPFPMFNVLTMDEFLQKLSQR